MTQVTVIIPSFNTRESLRACLNSLKTTLPMDSEVIVVDNGSTDGSQRMVADQFGHVRLMRNQRKLGLAQSINQGIERARGAYVLLLAAESQVVGGTVKQMLSFLEQNLRYGAVTPRVMNPDGTTPAGHMRFPTLLTPLCLGTPLERWSPRNSELLRYFARDFDYDRDGDVEQPPAVCLLMRRKALKKEKPLDESLGLYFHEVDLCKRLNRAGWRIGYLASTCVIHRGALRSRQFEEFEPEWHKDRLAYYRKHYGGVSAWWVKACVGWTVIDHCVHEFWRRAHGQEDEPLSPVWQTYAAILKH